MASFNFQAKSLEGKVVNGEVDASSEAEARVKIRSQQLVPLRVVAKTSSSGAKGLNFSFGKKKVATKELAIFTRQFSVLIGAGVPVMQSLDAMIGAGRSPAMNDVLKAVVGDIEKGKRLADTIKLHPQAFDRMYVNLVMAGEEGGVLDEVLNRLATYIEKANKLRGKVTGALWYPAAIVMVSFLVIAAILTFVIPSFVEMFRQTGNELPALTQFVIDLSESFKSNWYLILGVMIGSPFAIKTYYKTDEGRKVIDNLMVRVPLFGDLIIKGGVARFARTLATLLTAGVRIMDALDIAAQTSGSWVLESTIMGCKESISKGRTLAEPLRDSKFIPSMVTQMIAVGEATGNLDTMLGKVADFYEEEVEATADAMTSLIEPILMVFLGGIIAVLVIAMYLPIFNLAGAIG